MNEEKLLEISKSEILFKLFFNFFIKTISANVFL